MKGFLKAAGITIAVALIYMLLVGMRMLGESLTSALILGGAASVSGVVIGGALFYLVRPFLAIRWYTRLPCALLSGFLSLIAFSQVFQVSAGPDTGEVIVAVTFLIIIAPVPLIIGVTFGAGIGYGL